MSEPWVITLGFIEWMAMNNQIMDQVNSALRDSEARSFVNNYLNTLQANLQHTESRFQNLTLQIFLLFAAFELLMRSAIAEVNIGPFKLSQMSLVQKLLPAVIAYNYYEQLSHFIMSRLQAITYHSIIRNNYKSLYDNDLDYYLLPSSAFIIHEILSRRAQSFTSKLFEILVFPLKLSILIGPIFFEAYAFYKLFNIFGFNDFIVWVMLAISVLFLLQGFIFFLFATYSYSR